MLPGVTGLAQVNLPPDTDLPSVRRKLVLDRQYVQDAGMWLDFRLFLCTIGRMFHISLADVLALRRAVDLPDSADPSADTLPPFGGAAALHATHANGNNNGQSRPHAGDGATRAHRNEEVRIRPR